MEHRDAMFLAKRLACGWLCGWLCGWTLASGLPAAENPPAVVWRIEGVGNVGGQLTEVIGAPRVLDRAVVFNGSDDGLLVAKNPLVGLPAFTVEVLFFPAENGLPEQRFWHAQDLKGARALLETRLNGNGGWWLDTYLANGGTAGLPLVDPRKVHPTNAWYWVALRYDGKTMAHFVDGVKEREGPVEFGPMGEGKLSLGVRQNRMHWFKGAIREVRVTPAALAQEALQLVK